MVSSLEYRTVPGTKSETIKILAEKIDQLTCSHCDHKFDISQREMFSDIQCPKCGKELVIPGKLGDFYLLKPLGSGGMATVYLGYDYTLGRYVAIKVMKQALGKDPQFVANFLREARACAQINHSHVVQIYQASQQHGQPYIVMELISGGKLDELMKQRGSSIDETRTLLIARDVAKGLKAAADIGLYHGDIKPANILFEKSGLAKVTDFGLADFVHKQRKKADEEIWGTPFYIAPEKVQHGAEDHRSDIYSLGATLYHVLAGEPPFDGKTPGDVVVARLNKPVPDLYQKRPDLQPTTVELINRMLDPNPLLRFPTYNALLSSLDHAIEESKKASGFGTQVIVHNKADWSSRMGKLLLILIALSLLTLLILRVYSGKKVIFGGEKQPPSEVIKKKIAAPTIVYKPQKIVPLQPFSLSEDKLFFAIISNIANYPHATLTLQLDTFKRRLPEKHAGQLWVELMQCTSAMLSGEDRRADEYLEHLLSIADTTQADGSPHAAYLVKILGSLFSEKPLYIDADADQWPNWYRDLYQFYSGFSAIRSRDFERGRQELRQYARARRPQLPIWPYAFQNVADLIATKITDWESVQSSVKAAILEEDFENAQILMNRYLASCPPMLKPMVAVGAERYQGQIEKGMTIRQKVIVQRDYDALNTWRFNQKYIVDHEFFKAFKELTELESRMMTLEGRKAVEVEADRFRRMNELHTYIMRTVKTMPYEGMVATWGGIVVNASMEGLTVIFEDEKGSLVRPWRKVNYKNVLTMAVHYIMRSDMSEEKKADLLASASVYSSYFDNPSMSGKIARQAVAFDPDIKTVFEQLLPQVNYNAE